MTDEEIKTIKFYFVSHMAMVDEHYTTYISECGRFGKCEHVPYKNDTPCGCSYTHYRIGDKIYKTKKEFLKALKEL